MFEIKLIQLNMFEIELFHFKYFTNIPFGKKHISDSIKKKYHIEKLYW